VESAIPRSVLNNDWQAQGLSWEYEKLSLSSSFTCSLQLFAGDGCQHGIHHHSIAQPDGRSRCQNQSAGAEDFNGLVVRYRGEYGEEI